MKSSETGQGLGTVWGAHGFESTHVSEPAKLHSWHQGLSLLICKMGD